MLYTAENANAASENHAKARIANRFAFGLHSALMKTRTHKQKLARLAESRRRPANPWAAQVLAKMGLREKLGQLLMIPFFGGFQSTESAEYRSALRAVEEIRAGGLILDTAFGPSGIKRSQAYPSAILANEFQRRAKIPLLIGADFESGTRMRLEEGTAIPSAMAIAATGDPTLAYKAGKITALEARAVGAHWIFAPVADINSNPDNPIINFRSFGEDARSVARYIAEFVRGVEENGALATAKHFPGHGNVAIDSHLALAAVPGDRTELEGRELIPFRAAIDAGVSAIMPGHLAVAALEPDPRVPATLSKRILTGLLRGEWHFHGLIITDAMVMNGITSFYPPGEAAVRAVEAGADVLLMPPAPDAAIAALEEAVRSGRITEQRVNESVQRILAAKERLELNKRALVAIDRLNERFGRPEYEATAQGIGDRGITLLRDERHLLPLEATKPMRVLIVAISGDRDPSPAESFVPEVQSRVDSVTVLRADTHFSSVKNIALPPPDSYDVAIAAIFVRVADRKGHVGLPQDQAEFVNGLIAAGKPAIVAAFGSPYLVERFPNAKTWLAAFSTNSPAQRAAARAIFGQTAIGGKIPVTVPGVAACGAGMRTGAEPMTLKRPAPGFCNRLGPVYDLLERAVRSGVFPGGVLAVGRNGAAAVHPFGRLSWDKGSPRVTAGTIYDVASLTKPIVTTTALMILAEKKQIDLDAPVARYLPEFADAAASDPGPCWRSRVTPRMLLMHDSGLPAHRDFYKSYKGKRSIVRQAIAEPLIHEPGTQIEYSDVGFILLGQIVEQVTGESLDAFAKTMIFAPLGMTESGFNPPKSLRARIAPTEKDASFRKRLLRGEVHDENAFAMGGITGHAGLFSTAGDTAAFAQMMLNGGIYAHRRVVARSTVAEFTARHDIGNSASALGWDVPTKPSSSGRYFSGSSFGHLGFTGTSLWIDPERDLFVALLTNRVHPTRANEKIREVRPALHDSIVEALRLPDAANEP